MKEETKSVPGLSYNKMKPIDPDPDSALVARCRHGDLEAFEQLVSTHQKRMLNTAFRMIGDYEEACEAVQDAFVAAYRNIRSFRGEARFRTWMTTITLNQARNRLKQVSSRANKTAFSLDAPVETGEGNVPRELPCPRPSALERMEEQDRSKKVRECISALEPEYREVIILRDLQDLSYEEIGTALQMRPGTVKSRLFRARDSVRECLKKAFNLFER